MNGWLATNEVNELSGTCSLSAKIVRSWNIQVVHFVFSPFLCVAAITSPASSLCVCSEHAQTFSEFVRFLFFSTSFLGEIHVGKIRYCHCCCQSSTIFFA